MILKHQRGFTLLELLLVLIIAAAIIFLGISRYQQMKRIADIEAVKHNIAIIQDAANAYYQQKCNIVDYPNNNFNFSIKDLGALPLKSTKLINVTNYNTAARWIGNTKNSNKPIYQLLVSATLNTPITSIHFYQQTLGANSAEGTKLTWVQLPTYSIPQIRNEMWVEQSGLNYFKEFVLKNTSNQIGTITDISCGY